MFVMSVEFLTDHTAIVETTGNAHVMRHFNGAAMRASGASSKSSFPVGTAVRLIRMADSFLGNWHGDKPLVLMN